MADLTRLRTSRQDDLASSSPLLSPTSPTPAAANPAAVSGSSSGKPKKNSIVVEPIKEGILTLIFVAETLALLYLFVVVEKDFAAILTIAVTTVVTAFGVTISRGAFKALAFQIGSTKALDKPRNVRKFVDQGWQFVIHLSMTIFEVYILKDKPWFFQTKTAWEDLHRPVGAVRYLYLLQLGIRLWSTFSHRFIEAKHKDYDVMFIHHVITIALLGGSYMGGFYKIGVLVLVVHNGSDIVVDILKLSNYMDLAGRKYCFLTEIIFVLQLITWSIFRLWFFPFRIIWSTWTENPYCPLYCQVLRVTLHILLMMHIWWFFLFLRIGYRLVTKKSAHDAGRQEYEGGSSDDEDGRRRAQRGESSGNNHSD